MTDAPATQPPFGALRLAPPLERLVGRAQGRSGWLAQQWAQALRKWVIHAVGLPVDVTVGAIRLRVFLKDNNSEKKFVFMPWRFDPRERERLRQALPADGVFVDIGANVGIYTLWAAHHLAAPGRVLAFEPNPNTFGRLAFNVAANAQGNPRWPRVELLNCGISDREQELELALDPRNLGSASLAPDVARNRSTCVRVRCRPLLDVLTEHEVTRIDALKIDIEGYEDVALGGFLREAPRALLPGLLIVENSPRLWRTDFRATIEQAGYRREFETKMNLVYSRGSNE